MHKIALCAGAAVVGVLLLSASMAAAQTSCLVYGGGSTPPFGYGASWDVFDAARSLLLKVNCPASGTDLTMTVGRGNASQYVYEKAYMYKDNQWHERTLEGDASGGWIQGQGTVDITSPASVSASNPFYFVGYVCTNRGSQGWKCGCANSFCSTPYWQVQGYKGNGGGGGQPVGDETALCYPTSGKRTVPVADKVALVIALTNAQPGDHLVLAGGTYLGFIYSKNGTANDPIVIKPAAGALVTFTGTITMDGSYGVLAGSSFSSSARIKLSGHHNRITRNYFFDQNVGSGGVIDTVGDGIHDNRIDHNHFHRISGAAFRSDGWSNDGATDNQGTRIDHNYFQDHTVAGGNESVVLMLGDAYSDSKLLYDYNIFDDVLNNSDSIGQAELVTIKTSGTTWRANTVLNSPGVIISLRQTNDSIIEDNYMEGGASIRVHGDDHIIRNNKITGGKIIVSGGDGTMDTRYSGCDKSDTSPVLPPPNCKPVHAASRNTVVSDNIAPIVVGDRGRGDVASVNTTLRNNTGSVSIENNSGLNRTDGSPTNTARKLAPGDVGRSAPDPSCQ